MRVPKASATPDVAPGGRTSEDMAVEPFDRGTCVRSPAATHPSVEAHPSVAGPAAGPPTLRWVGAGRASVGAGRPSAGDDGAGAGVGGVAVGGVPRDGAVD